MRRTTTTIRPKAECDWCGRWTSSVRPTADGEWMICFACIAPFGWDVRGVR